MAAKAGRRALLLLAAVLIFVGLPVGGAAPAPADSTDVSVEHSVVVSAIPPGRVIGRLAADPSLLKIQSVAEFGVLPGAGPVLALVRLGGQDDDSTPDACTVRLPAAGDRAPPVPQADL
jgi:hypothetical protein